MHQIRNDLNIYVTSRKIPKYILEREGKVQEKGKTK